MQDVPIDKLLQKTSSLYKLVILAARRALELSDNAAPLITLEPGMKIADIALREIVEGKIEYKIKEAK